MYRRRKEETGVVEDVKIAIDVSLRKFAEDEEKKELEFPSSLTSVERKYIHNYAAQLGFKTKSRGKGFNRFLTVFKRSGSTVQSDATFQLSRMSQTHIISMMQRNPLTDKERRELLFAADRDRAQVKEDPRELSCTTGKLSSGIPQVPPPSMAYGHSNTASQEEMMRFRRNLPIWQFQQDIVNCVTNNSVVLITGETGCGKTTQVPQFILEHSYLMKKPCRIICSEPRRLAALSVAERVSQERGEGIGQTVGYQIRLESKVSPRTLLTFCTHGVLLRTLMGDSALKTVTHVIIDEIHERDRYSDFLLLKMLDVIRQNKSEIKLILMSATFDTQRFVQYFGGCPVLNIPGNCYEVKYYFLEDVLKMTEYMTPAMKKYKEMMENKNMKQKKLLKWCEDAKFVQAINSNNSDCDSDYEASPQLYGAFAAPQFVLPPLERSEVDDYLREKVDHALRIAWTNGSDQTFRALLDLILTEHLSVDYQHSETGVTPLIAAACQGKLDIVEMLLSYGASPTVMTPNDWDAYQWAKYFRQEEVAELLEAYLRCEENKCLGGGESKYYVSPDLTEEEKKILSVYHNSFNDDDVDINLIVCLLHHICNSSDVYQPDQPKGSILIFLPGYDEIVKLREYIINDSRRFDPNKYILFTLHSQMQSSDQKKVFKRVPSDIRKIILSTNIAETSITIDDVVFVIDSGKVKEKTYDWTNGISLLKSVWISKSSAIQRRGRAGRVRPGVCYHMFSKTRFNNMHAHQIPEMQRMPIHELCLHTKLLAPSNIPIADFLARAPDPPSPSAVKSAIHLLKKIDALDSNEMLTELGLHLLDLPIEPNLGKMIIYSVLLKCLDPVLTIVCSLAYRDPFVIPTNQSTRRRSAASVKKKLSADTFSDHMILLRTFQAWQKARFEGYEKSFCEHHFVSSATMEMIVGMRAQLLGQLRASGFVRARGVGDIRDLNVNSENWAVIKASLCAGTYPNMMRVDLDKKQMTSQSQAKIRFHPSSVLNSDPSNPRDNIYKNRAKYLKNLPSDWFVFEELTRSGRISYARCCTLLSPITVAIFAGPTRLGNDSITEDEIDEDSDSEKEDKSERRKAIFKIDDWISFRVDPEIARLTFSLRQKWHSLFLRRMTCPSKPASQADENVVKTIVEVLSAEEHNLRLKQPTGIGQRPRPMSTDFCPAVSSNISLISPIGKNSAFHRQNHRYHYSPRQQSMVFRPSPNYSQQFK